MRTQRSQLCKVLHQYKPSCITQGLVQDPKTRDFKRKGQGIKTRLNIWQGIFNQLK